MFGYVRPAKDKIDPEEFKKFHACYCGFCHSLKKHYGLTARFVLNYDFTFLAMLISEDTHVTYEQKRCIASPIQKKCICADSPWYQLAGAHSVILTYWKIVDEINDEGFFKGLVYRVIKLLLKHSYNKAVQVAGEYNKFTENKLRELSNLEKNKCPEIDETADKFALILRYASEIITDCDRKQFIGDILYHTGRAVYLMDAYDDLKDDIKSGSYNCLKERFKLQDNDLDEQDKKYLDSTIDASIKIICQSYEKLPNTVWSEIIKNIVYIGLPYMKISVMSGMWHDRKKILKERKKKGN